MSTNSPCAAIVDLLPELALGVLTGRERALALSHVESCPRCAEELAQLSGAADAVLVVAPEAEPPLGFEVDLLERMGVRHEPATAVHRRRPPAWALAAAVAVAALVVGVAVGWSVATSPPRPSTAAVGTPSTGAAVASAVLTHGGQSVGHVTTSGANPAWMYMTLDDAPVSGTVTCEVVTNDGVTHTIGTFTVKRGYGAWGAPLPVAPGDVHQAQVVSATGTVIAAATFR